MPDKPHSQSDMITTADNFKTVRKRDAWATIRGYIYQFDTTVLRWLNLEDGQYLEPERGEDIDRVAQEFDEALRSDPVEFQKSVRQN